MFYFGDPKETASIFWDNSINGDGPIVPNLPLDELEEQDLRNVFTYLYRSVKKGLQEGASDEVMAILIEQYDEAFVTLAEGSDRFKEAVRTNLHQPVTGYTKKSVAKYKKLAGL